jgi:tetratricopeptide (TPR) repeat protein
MATQIEKTAKAIEQACVEYYNVRDKIFDLMKEGKSLDAELTNVGDKIGAGLKDLKARSAAIEEAWRLNERQWGEGRTERDSYDRRFRLLTQEMSALEFEFRERVRIELGKFERQLDTLLEQWGVPSTLPAAGQEFKLGVTEEKKAKVEAIAKSVEETRQTLGEVVAKETSCNPEAYKRLAIFYAQSKNWTKAEEYFERALEINPEDAMGWRGLGYTYFQRGDYVRATADYLKAIEINPDDAVMWYNLGTVYGEQGDYGRAIASYKKALEIKPEFAAVWCNLGTAYQMLGNQEEAKKCIDKAKELGYPK